MELLKAVLSAHFSLLKYVCSEKEVRPSRSLRAGIFELWNLRGC